MVGLSDIPCVGIALNRISEATVEAAYRGLRYMFCYKGLVNVLNSEIEKINIQEGRLLTKVVEENNNGKILEDHVTKWHKEVEGIKEDSNLFLERYKSRASWRCIQCVPNIPNPLSRFRIGRESVKKAERLAELTESGKELLANEIAHLPPVDNLPKTDGVFQNFASRKDAYDKLWESLVSEGSPQIHGIYGMPGVGKTRIAEQIWEDAKTRGKFDKFTMAVVSSGELNVIKLQQDLAGHLNCTFASQDNVDRRASQLKQSIMNGGKVLIILDDVWWKIPLNVIGIQFGEDGSSKGCKILFTSREENVLRSNNCLDPVKITALKDDEAWLMFEESVGTGNIPDEPLAKKVCDKCAGLPLVIRAVGKALKFVSRDSWIDALERLENCEIESVPGIEPKVYACLKLSFDKLEKDAKLCLLLCSLYPEDANISIRMLIHLATGSQLVRGGPIRVHAMVAILKSSLLVLKNEDDKDFKLHDIIRDVARSIAVKDHAFSFIRCDSELPDSSGTPKLLCLQMDKSDFYIPDNLMYQDIHTFWVESAWFASQFQVLGVVSKFVNLRLLVLRNICEEQQTQNIPLQHLDKLRMIVLQDCDIGAIDFNLFPENIETLCIWDGLLPEPLNIVNLKHLRKLEIIKKYGQPVVLVANTISSLSSLEELHIPKGFKYHKAEEHNDDEVNYNNNSISQQLAEFTNLRRLKSLNMSFREDSQDDISVQAPKVISNLSEFHISVGDYIYVDTLLSVSALYHSLTRKSIHLCGKRFEAATFQSLIERAQVVILTSTNVDVSSAFNTNNTAAFADLKHLEIYGSDTMEHLAKLSFFKLTRLRVGNCSAMKYLFCNSVAKCLVQLEELLVNDCPVMEAIVMNEGIVEEEDVRRGNIEASSSRDKKKQIIEFIQLGKVTLKDLPNLRSFMSGADYECHMPALKEVKIGNCGFSTLFPFSVISSLQQLEGIEISNCALLEGIVEEEDVRKRGNIEASSSRDKKKKKIIKLFQLKYVTLRNLPNLRSFMYGADYECHMPALQKVEIDNCGFSTLSTCSTTLQQLQSIEISNCALLEGIVEEDDVRRGNIEASSSRDKKKQIIEFIHLEKVTLKGLPNLRSFMSGADYECHMPALREVKIRNCGFSTLFPFSVISSLQQLERIKISDCALLEGIVEEDVRRGNIEASSSRDKKKKKIIKLFQLEKVILKDLPKLRCFMYGADYECHMPALEYAIIDNCGFSTLFTCSTNLQLLFYLKVSNCRLLEYIVGDVRDDDDDDDDISKTDDKIIITLSHLWEIELENLPYLKSFSRTSSYDFNMPELSCFTLLQCPQVENFSSLKTSTGTSIYVTSDWYWRGEYVENLNDYIKENRKRDDGNLISDEGGAAAGETDDDS